VQTTVDGSYVSLIAGTGAGGHALAAIEPLEGDGAVLAELARTDGSQVVVGQGHVQEAGFPPPAVDASAFLAELARAVDRDFRRPTTPRRLSRLRPRPGRLRSVLRPA